MSDKQGTSGTPPQQSGSEIRLNLSDLEIVESVEIRNPEVVERLKAIKEQGLEGIKVSIETT